MSRGLQLHKGRLKLAESDVSRQINDFLRLHGWRCQRMPSVVLPTKNGRRMRIGENGIPDWECVRPVCFGMVDHFYREDKATGGRLTPAQLAWHAAAVRAGYLVCSIPPDCEDPLTWFLGWYGAQFEKKG